MFVILKYKNAFTEGQMISKANFLVLIWTKNQTELFFDFCPSILKEVGSKKIKSLYTTN